MVLLDTDRWDDGAELNASPELEAVSFATPRPKKWESLRPALVAPCGAVKELLLECEGLNPACGEAGEEAEVVVKRLAKKFPFSGEIEFPREWLAGRAEAGDREEEDITKL